VLVQDPAEWEWGDIARRQVSHRSRGAGTASAHRGFDRFAAFTPGYPPARLRRFHRPPPLERTIVDLPGPGALSRGGGEEGRPRSGPAVFASLDAPATFWHRSAVRILPVATFRSFLFARSQGARPLRGLHLRLSASAPSALPPPAPVRRNGRGPSGTVRFRAGEAGGRGAARGTGGLRFARRAGYLLAPLRGADPAVQGASPSRSSLQHREKFLGPDARSTDERAERPARNVIVVGNRKRGRMARFDEDDVAALLGERPANRASRRRQ
jgi:hypothetical protein